MRPGPTENMETTIKKWRRGHVRLHWVLAVALCVLVEAVSPVMTQARLPACQSTDSGQSACTCNNNQDGLQLNCNNRNPALTQVPSSIPEKTAVL